MAKVMFLYFAIVSLHINYLYLFYIAPLWRFAKAGKKLN